MGLKDKIISETEKVNSNNKAKEYLQQVKSADLAINDKLEELAKLEALATKINSVNEGERVQSSGSQDKVADAVCEIADLKADIDVEIKHLLALKREIREVIQKVGEPELMSILYKRYMQYKSWEKISVELNISYRHATRLHGKALQNVEKILNMS